MSRFPSMQIRRSWWCHNLFWRGLRGEPAGIYPTSLSGARLDWRTSFRALFQPPADPRLAGFFSRTVPTPWSPGRRTGLAWQFQRIDFVVPSAVVAWDVIFDASRRRGEGDARMAGHPGGGGARHGGCRGCVRRLMFAGTRRALPGQPSLSPNRGRCQQDRWATFPRSRFRSCAREPVRHC